MPTMMTPAKEDPFVWCLESAARRAQRQQCRRPEEEKELSCLLHKACQVFPDSPDIIEMLLLWDPEAARCPISIPAPVTTSSSAMVLPTFEAAGWWRKSSRENKVTRGSKSFQYPINIALRHGASPSIIELLAKCAPEVLLQKDGREGLTSLAICLTYCKSECQVDIVDTLLACNPLAIATEDRHQNTPLHMACQRPKTSLRLVRALVQMNPMALSFENRHGYTPLQVAQRNGSCPEDVVNYLIRATKVRRGWREVKANKWKGALVELQKRSVTFHVDVVTPPTKIRRLR